jgi:hypothetical protein
LRTGGEAISITALESRTRREEERLPTGKPARTAQIEVADCPDAVFCEAKEALIGGSDRRL